jgi:hypothetical protein
MRPAQIGCLPGRIDAGGDRLAYPFRGFRL